MQRLANKTSYAYIPRRSFLKRGALLGLGLAATSGAGRVGRVFASELHEARYYHRLDGDRV